MYIHLSRNFYAGVAELVDAQVLGTCVPSDVWVRVPPPALALTVTISDRSWSLATNFMESELTQWRVFLAVNLSPVNTCPRCPSQLAQTISVRRPSASFTRRTRPGISSSKLGHPHPERNLSSDRYSGDVALSTNIKPRSIMLVEFACKGALRSLVQNHVCFFGGEFVHLIRPEIPYQPRYDCVCKLCQISTLAFD